MNPKPDIRRIFVAAVVAPLSIFVIVPVGLLFEWAADGPRFDAMSSALAIGGVAAGASVPALLMTLIVGVPLYVVALRRNLASIWLAVATGFVCPWVYFLGRYALIEAASPLYHSMTFVKFWLGVAETVLDAKFLVIPLSLLGMLVGTVFWFLAPRPDHGPLQNDL